MSAFVGSVWRASSFGALGYRYLAVSGDIAILDSGAKSPVLSLLQAKAEAKSPK
jgi:hypothetical protein